MKIESYFDKVTSTLTYLVWEGESAVLIDPVLDFDSVNLRISEESARKIASRIKELSLKLEWVFETHVHADHLSAAQFFKNEFGAKIGIGRNIVRVQKRFREVFNLDEFKAEGRDFDRLFFDEDQIQVGKLEFKVMETPGHTPACVSYLIHGALFTGDALFMPDFGTGRCDFPDGDAKDLFESIQRIYSLPDETRIFVGHDYQPGGRDLQFETSVGESKKLNKHIQTGTVEAEFCKFRKERDATLDLPKLIFQSLQVNMRAGQLPSPESNQLSYFKIPINAL